MKLSKNAKKLLLLLPLASMAGGAGALNITADTDIIAGVDGNGTAHTITPQGAGTTITATFNESARTQDANDTVVINDAAGTAAIVINNTRAIRATQAANQAIDFTGVGNDPILDLTINTGGSVIHENDPADLVINALGNGNHNLTNAGTITGNVTFGDGDITVNNTGTHTATGTMAFGNGTNTLNNTGAGVMDIITFGTGVNTVTQDSTGNMGNITFGVAAAGTAENKNVLTTSNTGNVGAVTFSGGAFNTFNHGGTGTVGAVQFNGNGADNSMSITSTAAGPGAVASVVFTDGDRSSLTHSGTANITGVVTMGGGDNNTFTHSGAGNVGGATTFGNGADNTLTHSGTGTMGDITFGTGNNSTLVHSSTDAAATIGNVNMNNGNDNVVTHSSAANMGTLDFGTGTGNRATHTGAGEIGDITFNAAGTLNLNGSGNVGAVTMAGAGNTFTRNATGGTLGAVTMNGGNNTVNLGTALDMGANAFNMTGAGDTLNATVNADTAQATAHLTGAGGINLTGGTTITPTLTNTAQLPTNATVRLVATTGGSALTTDGNITVTTPNLPAFTITSTVPATANDAAITLTLVRKTGETLLGSTAPALTGTYNAISAMGSAPNASADAVAAASAIQQLGTTAEIAGAVKNVSGVSSNVAVAGATGATAAASGDVISGRTGEAVAQGSNFRHFKAQSFKPTYAARHRGTGSIFERGGAWFKAFGDFSRQKERKGDVGYNANFGGVAIGADTQYTDSCLIGMAASFTHGQAKTREEAVQRTDIDGYRVYLYGAYTQDRWFADGFAGYGYNRFDNDRRIVFGTIDRRAKAKFHGHQPSAKVRFGYNLPYGGSVKFSPYASLYYSKLSLSNYTETGADALNRSVVNETTNRLDGSLGMRMGMEYEANKMHFMPAIDVAYSYDFIGDKAASTNTLAGGGTAFNTSTAQPARGAVDAGASLAMQNLKRNVEFSVGYNYKAKSKFDGHSAFAKIRYMF